jgi:hypothetical protein
MGFALLYAWLWAVMLFVPDTLTGPLMGWAFGMYHWVIQMPLVGLAGLFHPKVRSGEIPDPGLWAVRYGPGEALVRLAGHMAFGALFGSLYPRSLGWPGLLLGLAVAVVGGLWLLARSSGQEPAPNFMAFLRKEDDIPVETRKGDQ